jgi:hypothetical protein
MSCISAAFVISRRHAPPGEHFGRVNRAEEPARTSRGSRATAEAAYANPRHVENPA